MRRRFTYSLGKLEILRASGAWHGRCYARPDAPPAVLAAHGEPMKTQIEAPQTTAPDAPAQHKSPMGIVLLAFVVPTIIFVIIDVLIR
jgi:hypothetical protein